MTKSVGVLRSRRTAITAGTVLVGVTLGLGSGAAYAQISKSPDRAFTHWGVAYTNYSQLQNESLQSSITLTESTSSLPQNYMASKARVWQVSTGEICSESGYAYNSEGSTASFAQVNVRPGCAFAVKYYARGVTAARAGASGPFSFFDTRPTGELYMAP